MTKEELEKEAEGYATENYEQCIYDDVIGWQTDYEARKQAYLAGAEPREKRIADLEAQIEEIRVILCEYSCLDEKTKHYIEVVIKEIKETGKATTEAENFLKESEVEK